MGGRERGFSTGSNGRRKGRAVVNPLKTRDIVQVKRAGIFLFQVCLLSLFLSACSGQLPGAGVDSIPVEKLAEKDRGKSPSEANRDRTPLLKVDYLTPLQGIRQPRLFIYKEKRRLYVIQDNVLVRDYPIGLGTHPRGHKQKEGDGRTPEGEFQVKAKSRQGPYSKSLLLDSAKDAGPWSSPLSSRISLHGGGAHTDWTDGDIALYDSDMRELYAIVSPGTPVMIRP